MVNKLWKQDGFKWSVPRVFPLLRDKPEESATWEQKQIFMDEIQLLNSLSWLTSFFLPLSFSLYLVALLRKPFLRDFFPSLEGKVQIDFVF